MTFHDPRDGDPLYIVGPDYLDRKPGMFRSWTPLLVAVLIVIIAALFVTQVAASRSASNVTSRAAAEGKHSGLTGALRPVTSTAAEDNSVPLHIVDLLGVTGRASWYCSTTSRCTRGYPASGLFAAAGPALRHGNWRGRIVEVCTIGQRGICINVRLVDWCACPRRVIDLYQSAFAGLSPDQTDEGRAWFVRKGVIRVTVSDSSIALPQTDTVR